MALAPRGDRFIEPLNMVAVGDDAGPDEREERARAVQVLRQTTAGRQRSTSVALENELDAGRVGRPKLEIVGGKG